MPLGRTARTSERDAVGSMRWRISQRAGDREGSAGAAATRPLVPGQICS